MRSPRTVASSLWLGVAIIGCTEPDAPVPTMPADFALSIGSGGGFAGTWHTTDVAADGSVTAKSSGRAAPHVDAREPRGHLDDAARRANWRDLHEAGFFWMASAPGNMSTAMTVTAHGRTTSVAHEIDSGPPAFRDLVASIGARIRAAHAAPR